MTDIKHPSVTQIISPWADFSMIKPDVLERAAARGTKVHQICAAIATGLWVPSVPEECQGYIDSFRRWWDLVETVHIVEEEIIDETYGFLGHMDICCTLKNEESPVVVDHKTPIAQQKSWKLQLAAYHRLAEIRGFSCNRVFSLRLKKDGSLPIADECKDIDQHFNIFLGALSAYKYFNPRRD